jgi:hypothetical protein
VVQCLGPLRDHRANLPVLNRMLKLRLGGSEETFIDLAPAKGHEHSITSSLLSAELRKVRARRRSGRIALLHSADLLGDRQPDKVIQRCAFRFCYQPRLLAEVIRQPEYKALLSTSKLFHFWTPPLAREPQCNAAQSHVPIEAPGFPSPVGGRLNL